MNQYLYLPLKPTNNHLQTPTNNINKLMFLILLALSTCTSANTSHSSSNGINPHPHAHHTSSETLFQLVDRVRASKLIRGLAPWSWTFTPPDSTHIVLLPGQTLESMPMHSKADKKRWKEKEAMAAATPQKEKDATEKHKLIELWRTETNSSRVTKVGAAYKPPPTVVSPPSALNLNSLLTSHVGQERGTLLATDTNKTAMVTEMQAKDTVKSPKKKKSKKVMSTSKEDKIHQAWPQWLSPKEKNLCHIYPECLHLCKRI